MSIRKIYPFFIELDAKSNGEFTTDSIKYDSKNTISEAKKFSKSLSRFLVLTLANSLFLMKIALLNTFTNTMENFLKKKRGSKKEVEI